LGTPESTGISIAQRDEMLDRGAAGMYQPELAAKAQEAKNLVFSVVGNPGDLIWCRRGLMVCRTRSEPLTPP
jgi:hypothetical protein